MANSVLPYTILNHSQNLFGFHFDFERQLKPLQIELSTNYHLTAEQRATARENLKNKFGAMYDSAINLLAAQCACNSCGEKPLVAGSRHEHFPTETRQEFLRLKRYIKGVHDRLETVEGKVIDGLKKAFEDLVDLYKKENFDAKCSFTNGSMANGH